MACFFAVGPYWGGPGNPQVPGQSHKEGSHTMHVTGPFEVKLDPQKLSDPGQQGDLCRMLIEKHFKGDLEGIGKGEMLAFSSSVKGSAGYVALEKVTGILQGRKVSFALQHTGIMARGEPQLTITVIPDSGTEELVGLTGTMMIKITEGKHFYEFDYSLRKAE